MATRRHKTARRGKNRQVRGGKPKSPRQKSKQKPAAKKRPARGGPQKAPHGPPKKKRPAKKLASKKSALPKRAKKPVKKRAKRQRKKRAPTFAALRLQAQKAGKLPAPTHPRRRGKTTLRGVAGLERSIPIAKRWEEVREGWLVETARRTFLSLVSTFRVGRPTLYTRFTFTVTRVMTLLSAGSPKLIRATRKRVKAWFLSSGLSYTVDGAIYQLERAIDTLNSVIADATRDNEDPEFFLEFITCVSYQV